MMKFAVTISILSLSISLHAAGPETPRFKVQDASEIYGEKTIKRSLYIGHYGETFTYSPEWLLFPPKMRDGIEIVRLVRTDGLMTQADPTLEPFFEHPEEYGPKRLEQLLVIPKESRSYQDLDTLRAAKEKDLTEKGFLFQISGPPMPFVYWPLRTFEVQITSPYRLTQVYTEAKGNLFIITDSGLTGSEDPIAGELARLYFSKLQVRHADEREAMETFAFLHRSIPLVACGILLLGLPWKRGLLRPLGSAALFGGLLSLILGFSAFHLAERLADAGLEKLVSPGALGWSIFAALFTAMAVRIWNLEGARRWISIAASIIGTLIALACITWIENEVQRQAHTIPQEFQVLNWWLGLVYGFCLGLTVKQGESAR